MTKMSAEDQDEIMSLLLDADCHTTQADCTLACNSTESFKCVENTDSMCFSNNSTASAWVCTDDDDPLWIVGYIAAAVIALLVILMVIFICCVCKRCCRKENPKMVSDQNGMEMGVIGPESLENSPQTNGIGHNNSEKKSPGAKPKPAGSVKSASTSIKPKKKRQPASSKNPDHEPKTLEQIMGKGDGDGSDADSMRSGPLPGSVIAAFTPKTQSEVRPSKDQIPNERDRRNGDLSRRSMYNNTDSCCFGLIKAKVLPAAVHSAKLNTISDGMIM